MALPVPTPISTGFADAVGSAFRLATNQLIVTDAGAGTISAVNVHSFAKVVLGTGYNAPSGIALSNDGVHAYVTENPGTLLRVSLAAANRASAVVVASGLNGIDQVVLDEAHGVAYVAEFTAARVRRIDLATGATTVVATVSNAARGVLLTGDARFLYASDDSGKITEFDLATNTHAVVASGLGAPRFLTWADAGNSVILVPVRNPAGAVMAVDLTASPATVAPITGLTPHDPYSVAIPSAGKLLITSADAVSQVDLTGFTAAGPILLGIGFVPADSAHIHGGYATTDPGYFFLVKDCPFGGTLPLMINWEKARSLRAKFYQIFIEVPGGPSVQVTQPFSDYLWSVALNQFELVTTVPTGGYYPLRDPGQIWLNHWLGALLDTTGRPNSLNKISIRLFASQNPGSEIGHATDAGRFASVMIDNTGPTANIEQIIHDGAVVNTCAIVNSGSHTFTFKVTASAPRHLRAWEMVAYWGDNQSKLVAADDYSHHVATPPIWKGLSGVVIPPPGPTPWDATVPGDPTSIHCAHTFFLYAWDRVINGWGYVHGDATYHKSITLMF